jgi:hypothetical protein
MSTELNLYEIPKWLHKSSKFNELFTNNIMNVKIELQYIRETAEINNLEDFYNIIEIILYWQLDYTPNSVLRFGQIISNEEFNMTKEKYNNNKLVHMFELISLLRH